MSYCKPDMQGFCIKCGKLAPFPGFATICGRRKTHGIGSHIKVVLRRLGIYATLSCKCKDMAKKINAWTPDEAEARKAEILVVMREEAGRRGLPFSATLATLIVRRAIANARKEASRGKTETT